MDEALHVSHQIAVPLQTSVERVDIVLALGREAGVDDFQLGLGRIQPGQSHVALDQLLPADQDGRAQALALERVGGADDARLLALGKDDAPARTRLQRHRYLLQQSRRRIGAPGETVAIGVHVRNDAARHAGVHRRLRDERGDVMDEPGVEGCRDDVLRPELQLLALIGGGHLVRHVFASQGRESVRASDLHFQIDPPRPHVQRTTKDVGKAQHIVDLVGIIGASGGDDRVGPHGVDILGRDLRIGVGHGEDDRLVGHRPHHVLAHGAFH